MRNYIKLFFLVPVFLAACSGSKVPPGIISQDDMAGVLTDVHIADGSLYSLSQVPDSLYKYSAGRYMAVFKKNHTDSVQFRKSMQYYTMHPDRLEDIYAVVLKNIQDKITEVNKIKTPVKNNALPAE